MLPRVPPRPSTSKLELVRRQLKGDHHVRILPTTHTESAWFKPARVVRAKSSNPRRCTWEEMEGQDVHHLKTYCTPYMATILDLNQLEQDPGESLRHYI